MFKLGFDYDIINQYSVKYEHNLDVMNYSTWENWTSKYIIKNFDSLVPDEFNCPRLIHNPRTPLTDVLDIQIFPRRGCVVSKKFVDIINRFFLPKIKHFPIEIVHKNKIHQYVYLFFVEDFTENIDYSNTRFDGRNNGKQFRNEIINYDEWLNAIKNEFRFTLESKDHESSIIFHEFSEDIFTLNRIFYDSIIVSSTLKIEMEKNLVGLKFRACEKFIVNNKGAKGENIDKNGSNFFLDIIWSPIRELDPKEVVADDYEYYNQKRIRLLKQEIQINSKEFSKDEYKIIEKKLNIVISVNTKLRIKEGLPEGYKLLAIQEFYIKNDYVKEKPESFRSLIVGENGVGDEVGFLLLKKSDYLYKNKLVEFLHEIGDFEYVDKE